MFDSNAVTDMLPDSFFRQPENRWLRACDLRRCGQRPGSFDDEWTGFAYVACDEHQQSPQVEAIRQAQAIWDTSDDQTRWEIESRILARQDDVAVARAMKLSAPIVEAYHEVFFNVRPRLEARDWIQLRVFGGLSSRNLSRPAQRSMLLKRLAYSGGPIMLETALAVFADSPLPPGVIRSSGLAAQRYEAALRLTVKAFLQLDHAATPSELVQSVRNYQQVQQRDGTGRTPSGSDDLFPAMIQLLAATETVAPKGPRPKRPARNTKAMTLARTALADLCLAIRH